jgi:DNA-3-methyladenine glycosylase II
MSPGHSLVLSLSKGASRTVVQTSFDFAQDERVEDFVVRTTQTLHESLDALAAREPAFAGVLDAHGRPEPRCSEPGATTLLRTIVGQQVSVAAARSMWAKLEAAFGSPPDLSKLLVATDDELRAAGISRQKAGYIRSLAELVLSGELDLAALPSDDEDAIALLTKVKGIGRWSAEIYLLFAEGRRDVWPAGDLAVQISIGRLLGLADRPSEKQLREIAEAWRPHRGAAAVLAWHSYNSIGTAL